MSKVFRIDPEKPSAEVINLAATVLRDGGIVVFPTETVYGIGASAHSCFGPHEIFDIKVRPLEKPLPWLVEDDDALLDTYGVDVPEYAHNLAKAFWPGALTLVVDASDKVGKDFRADDGTVALRSPDHEVVMELIQASGGPLIATSANTSGQPAPGDFVRCRGAHHRGSRRRARRRRDRARAGFHGGRLHGLRAGRSPERVRSPSTADHGGRCGRRLIPAPADVTGLVQSAVSLSSGTAAASPETHGKAALRCAYISAAITPGSR